uniref:Uncharacterized protein n=1 Tax=Opuntia streptacantha TaxID=393608 RepID=A0A7C9DF49_OPUST
MWHPVIVHLLMSPLPLCLISLKTEVRLLYVGRILRVVLSAFYLCRSVLVFQLMLMRTLNCRLTGGIFGLGVTCLVVGDNVLSGISTSLSVLLLLLMGTSLKSWQWKLVLAIRSIPFGQQD